MGREGRHAQPVAGVPEAAAGTREVAQPQRAVGVRGRESRASSRCSGSGCRNGRRAVPDRVAALRAGTARGPHVLPPHGDRAARLEDRLRATAEAQLRRGRLRGQGLGERQARRRAHRRLHGVQRGHHRRAASRGEQEIVVAVTDTTGPNQPKGKQSPNPSGIFYTPSSGIWQTVWLEPVRRRAAIDALKTTPDLATSTLAVEVTVKSAGNATVTAVARDAKGKQVGTVTGPANTTLTLPVPNPHLWTPDDPYLYELDVTARRRPRSRATSACGPSGSRTSAARRS